MAGAPPLLTVSVLEVLANIVQRRLSEGEQGKKIKPILVRLGCFQSRFCGPNLASGCPRGVIEACDSVDW